MQKHFVRTIFGVALKIFMWQPDYISLFALTVLYNNTKMTSHHNNLLLRYRFGWLVVLDLAAL